MKSKSHRRTWRLAAAMVVAALLAFGAYAFLASNTVPSSYAGDGQQTVSGYTITNVAYQLNSDPTKLNGLTFTLSPAAASTVKVTLDGSTWTTCTNTSGSVSCTFASPSTVVSAANLEVVATS
jgi:membrane protein implicated in regulation of membrane protease activity